jgi:very-short-patch-repair endonuclease
LSEVLFWQQVNKGSFYNIDFDRQKIIGNFIVDFYVEDLGLIIEIDGSSHENKQEYDKERQKYLEDLGLKFFRCTDLEVKFKLGAFMNALENFIIKEFGEC